jgi:hypothetical protein
VVSVDVDDEKRFDISTADGEVLWNGKAQYEATGVLLNKYPTSKQVVQIIYDYLKNRTENVNK